MIEQAAFLPYFSGMKNLRLWWTATGASWPPPALDRALETAGLGTAVNRRVKSYSLGMHQRLGIARALMGDPEILILDEPTVGLDPQEMRSIRRLLRDLAGEWRTVLLSSHLLAEVEEICSNIVVMDRGKLVAAGTAREVLTRSLITEHYGAEVALVDTPDSGFVVVPVRGTIGNGA